MAEQESNGQRYLRLLFAAIMLVVFAGCASFSGCSSTPRPTKPTMLTATIEATAAVNPDAKGRASPVVVRWFELRSVSTFNSADFFSLWDRERETLSSELIARDELLLRPSEAKKLERTLQPETRYIGVIASYRDLERSNWRASVATIAAQTQQQVQPVTIKLDARGVSISSR